MTDATPEARLERAIWDALRLLGLGTRFIANAVPAVDAILAAAAAYAALPADKIAIPRPGPGGFVIAVCGEDGATAWVTGSKTAMGDDGDLLRQLVPYLEESQQVIRGRREAARRGSADGQ